MGAQYYCRGNTSPYVALPADKTALRLESQGLWRETACRTTRICGEWNNQTGRGSTPEPNLGDAATGRSLPITMSRPSGPVGIVALVH